MTEERLAKRLAHAGLCSRREAERWIAEGRVTVGGKKILLPQHKVTDKDEIKCDGKRVPLPETTPRMWVYHKPRGVLTTERDPQGRPTIFDTLPKNLPRLISIGRLDMNSEGLLLLTNSGAIAREFELPKNQMKRTYHVRVYGDLTPKMQDTLKKGIKIDQVAYQPIITKMLGKEAKNRWIEFTLTEGKNREIRNVIAHFGLKLNRLVRVAYGPYSLGHIASGDIQEVDFIG